MNYRIASTDTDKAFCRILLDVAEAHGVRNVVCSPGSRNTPLLVAVSARRNLLRHVVVDERSAAFMALGLALETRRPVALICTSGTALLNYAPAVAEAYYQSVPLIVISADRPQQWIDQDDSQTIRQFEALRNFVKKSYSLPAVDFPGEEMLWMANRIANDAMTEALSGRMGPVHVNVSLDAPLGNKIATDGLPEQRIIKMVSPSPVPAPGEMARLAEEAAASRILFVAGFMQPDNRMNKAVAELSSLPNVYVMAETISNLHLDSRPWTIDTLLSSLDSKDRKQLAPDLIITVGGALVSRQVKEYLRGCANARHWSVGFSHTTVDCFKNLALRIEADRAVFIWQLARLMKRHRLADSPCTGYAAEWRERKKAALKRASEFVRNTGWCEMKAFDIILKSLPKGINLHLSNGTSIRYAQLLTEEMPHSCHCNRGVSGIDGSTSTAIGAAIGYNGMTLLITGDMSFSYDIGAFNLRECPDSMRIIVICNQGGGIFRFIPSTGQLEEREELFCADPQVPVKGIAEAYGWRYMEADSEETLRDVLPDFFDGASVKTVLKIDCDGILGASILKQYMTNLQNIKR